VFAGEPEAKNYLWRHRHRWEDDIKNYPQKDIWWAGIVQSVWQVAAGWMVRVSNRGGGRIFGTRPDRPWGPPSVYRLVPGSKAAGAWR
jgi:hypothetical protein